jgi:hypothetical protein
VVNAVSRGVGEVGGDATVGAPARRRATIAAASAVPSAAAASDVTRLLLRDRGNVPMGNHNSE